jgi:hypothetical protein
VGFNYKRNVSLDLKITQWDYETSNICFNIVKFGKIHQRFGLTTRLHIYCRKLSEARYQYETSIKVLVSYLAYFSTLTMEAIRFSETSVDLQRTTYMQYNPEYCIVQSSFKKTTWPESARELYQQFPMAVFSIL